jgi:hypothetical protein
MKVIGVVFLSLILSASAFAQRECLVSDQQMDEARAQAMSHANSGSRGIYEMTSADVIFPTDQDRCPDLSVTPIEEARENLKRGYTFILKEDAGFWEVYICMNTNLEVTQFVLMSEN